MVGAIAGISDFEEVILMKLPLNRQIPKMCRRILNVGRGVVNKANGSKGGIVVIFGAKFG